MGSSTPFILLALVLRAVADIHHLFASSYRSPHLFALEYDTATNSLTQVGNFSAHAGHPWLSFSYDRGTLYGSERDGWSSYRAMSSNEIVFQSNLTLRGRCDGGNYKHGTTSVIAEQRAPFNIFGAGRSPCGNVMSSNIDGSFDRIVQNITYKPTSRVHGMALDPENSYLYSADTSANGIWTHKVDSSKGTLTQAKFITHPESNARPRRLVLHPDAKYLYLLLSKLNKIAVYSVKMNPNGPVLAYTGLNYSLVPPGVNRTNYRGQEVALSADNNILYVTSRYRVQRREDDDDGDEEADEEGEDDEDDAVQRDGDVRQRSIEHSFSIRSLKTMFTRKASSPVKRQWPWSTSSRPKPQPIAPVVPQPGFLTAILLSSPDPAQLASPVPTNNRDMGPGYPLQVLLQVATSTSGGKSNSITPAHWSNEYVALADSEKGLVQVWRFDGLLDVPRAAPPPAPSAAQPQPVQAQPKSTGQPKGNLPPKGNAPANPLQQGGSWVPWPGNTNYNSNAEQKSGKRDGRWVPWLDNTNYNSNTEQQSGKQSGSWIPWSGNTNHNSNAEQQSGKQGGRWVPWSGNTNYNSNAEQQSGKQPRQSSGGNQGNGLGARGWGGKGKQKDDGGKISKRQTFNIRAAIVAEWKAPPGTIGEGDPAAPKSKNQQNDDQKGKVPQWGRGCCANAVWYD